MSEDRRYIVHKTTITDIKPVVYMEKVLANPSMEDEVEA